MSEGMDDPQLVPEENIRVDNEEAPSDISDIRPDSDSPFSVDEDKVTIIVWFMPAVPIKSVRLPTSRNVESFTVKYIRPSSSSSDSTLVEKV